MSATAPPKHGPLFLTFEGVEGCGKSTQLELLRSRLADSEIELLVTREPGGTELGQRLRKLLLEPTQAPMAPEAELLLYAADRAQHLREVIEPALAEGRIVLCDRYLDATLAYQGYGRNLGTSMILDLHRRAPLDRRPDRTLLFDLDPAIALERARRRNAELGVEETEGRFEMEQLDFHRRVRAGYLTLARSDPGRVRTVDAAGTPDEVARRVTDALRDLPPLSGTLR